MSIFKSRYKGYCHRCYFTIWKGEEIEWSGKAKHIDCIRALKDPTPRVLQIDYKRVYGDIKKKEMVRLLELKGTGLGEAQQGNRSKGALPSNSSNQEKPKASKPKVFRNRKYLYSLIVEFEGVSCFYCSLPLKVGERATEDRQNKVFKHPGCLGGRFQ